MTNLSENSEKFIQCALRKQSDENDKQLLELIEQGLDVNYIRYRSGSQRYDDGYYWGNAYYFLTYVLDNCSLNVMKKVFEKYPEIVNQTRTYNYSEYKGCDAYWVRGLNDCNGENPYVRDTEIANFLIQTLPSSKTICLENAFKKLSFKDCVKLLEDPNFSKEKKSVLAERSWIFNTQEDLLAWRPYLGKAQETGFDLKAIPEQLVISCMSDLDCVEEIQFENFPTEPEKQTPFIQKLADMQFRYVCAKDVNNKEIDLQKLVNEERQNRIEKENEGKDDWKIAFLKKCAIKDFKSALNILQEEDILSVRKETSEANFGREFDASPLGWGNNRIEVHNNLIAVDIKDMGDDTYAIGQIYENRKWRSTVGYSSGIGWYWQGEVAIVNLNKGVGDVASTDTICVRDPDDVSRDIFSKIPQTDFVSVQDDTATVRLGGYASANVSMPKAKETPKQEDLVDEEKPVEKAAEETIEETKKTRAEIQAEIRKYKDQTRALAEQLSKTTPKRHALAEKLNELRHEYGSNAKVVASQSKAVQALRKEVENER